MVRLSSAKKYLNDGHCRLQQWHHNYNNSSNLTVQLSNDKTGATGSATIQANGVDQSVVALFGNTPVGAGNHVVASSAQLTNFPQGVFCIIKQGETPVGILNFKKTFADLDGNPDVATPVNLDGAVLNCQV